MAWQAAYNAYGTEPLIRQLIAIIYRDIQSALDFVSGVPGSLKPFECYQLALSVAANFPAITLEPVNIDFGPEQQNIVGEAVPIFCAVAVAHQDPDVLAVLLQRYTMAVWHVLTAAYKKTSGDFLTSGLALPPSAYPGGQVTTGLAAGSLKLLRVRRGAFDELRRVKSIFVKAASLEIEAQLFEA